MFEKRLLPFLRRAGSKTEYSLRVDQEVAQYATEQIHAVPPIYDYWADTHIRPRLRAVMGVESVLDFYVSHIQQRITANSGSISRILSLGSGDADLEVQIASELLSRGLRNFQLECIELSPVLIERANRRIRDEALDAYAKVMRSDLNLWSRGERSDGPYAAVIANQILHHVVNLEQLFDKIAAVLGDAGVLLTADMIGRNGHMRWPEAIPFVNALWKTLPDPFKYNHVFGRTDHAFDNWDCSSKGFEGIRAQEILPLLVRRFRFEKFLAFGNLPDVFCDRFYGANFDPALPTHTWFIDSIERLNSSLLELGVLKPTKMMAVLSNCAVPTPHVWKNLTPEFCVRDPNHAELIPAQNSALAATAANTTLSFSKDGSGKSCLRTGWSYPEEWGTWMIGSEALLDLPVPANLRDRSSLTLRIKAQAFVPRRLHARSFTFMVDDSAIGIATFLRSESKVKIFDFDVATPANSLLSLRIVGQECASPAEEGSPDDRPLGLALVDISLYSLHLNGRFDPDS